MFNFNSHEVLCYNQSVDMRKSFQGLLGLVKHDLKADPLAATLFLFFNRRGNYLKLLFWDRTGYCLICKKLERGRFTLPENKNLDLQKLRLLFDGIKLGIK